MRIVSCSLALLLCASAAHAADPFSEFVRSTPALTPAEEARTFHLPPGFEIQLITSEPAIAKPMNLAFDSRGRLWVTESRTYPFPTKQGEKKKDCIKVIELAEDGSAKAITTFADNLDIPIGIYPITDGSSVIAYDINNIRKFTDTDGDGKADKIDVLYTGFGYDDTHGMSSNYRRGFDGWLYGCHGFKSVSDVKDRSGDVTHLQSGNTYRMRLDGSHFQAFTIGQINPFGLCFDPLGNMYTSDSHSKPIYQMLRGAHYEAFDRNTDDGLGLAPMCMTHLHGSTAIAGSQFYAAEQFPAEFRGNVFVGNVVTCRINRDKLEYYGSSPKAIEQPDFLSTDDPWFRPVNTLMGPDGAFYVADFYNRIIGHYEVKLDDPRRDHERGRLWRIHYQTPKVARFDISKANAKELIARLDDPNLLVRQLATNELSDRIGASATDALSKTVRTGTALQKIHAAWVLFRLNALPEGLIQQVASDADASVRVHAMRMLAETKDWSSIHRQLALKGLSDSALARRGAADALGQHPDVVNLRPLLDTLAATDPQDSHLVHTLRMAIRNQLLPADSFAKLSAQKLSDADFHTVAGLALAVPTPQSGEFILDHVDRLSSNKEELSKYLRHAVRYAAAPNVGPLAKLMQEKFADDIDFQLELFQSIGQGMAQRGQQLPDSAKEWGRSMAKEILGGGAIESDWTSIPLDRSAAAATPWDYEPRGGGKRSIQLLSSLPGGEQSMSILRSKPFTLPSKLSFLCAGHDGFPQQPIDGKNHVRLRLSDGDRIIQDSPPPRNDVAKKITWDTSAYAGQQAYIEVVDGNSGNAYAWLGIANLEPEVIKLPKPSPRAMQQRLQFAAATAAQTHLTEVAPALRSILTQAGYDDATRVAAASALATLSDANSVDGMSAIITDAQQSMDLRKCIAEVMGAMPAAQAKVVESFRYAPAELQTALAQALSANAAGGEALLKAVEAGNAPPRVLLDKKTADRLAAANMPDLKSRIEKLTRGVAAPKTEIEKLIADRKATFKTLAPKDVSTAQGEQIFLKNCAPCHQIENKGGQVGPNLAGLSKRGVDRLIEDILDPDRNVDPAFHYSNIFLKDGKVVTGLQKREEGEVIIFVDSQAKEIPVKKADIQRRFESPGSLMVSNFYEIIGPSDFNNLLAYLLTK